MKYVSLSNWLKNSEFPIFIVLIVSGLINSNIAGLLQMVIVLCQIQSSSWFEILSFEQTVFLIEIGHSLKGVYYSTLDGLLGMKNV